MNYIKQFEPNKIEKRNPGKPWRLAMWDITYFCNLSCKHCYNLENISKDRVYKSTLSLEQCKNTVDSLAQLGFNEVNLAGGEPLSSLYADRLIEYILSIGLVPSVNTNGLLLTRELADKLVRLKFSNLSISLAGSTEYSNSMVRGKSTLQKVMNNLEYFVNQITRQGVKNNISINFSLLKTNLDELPGLYRFCSNIGVSSVNIHLTQPMGAAVENSEIIESNYQLILDGFENLISNWGPDIKLILDTRPIAADYLCRKYRLPQPKTPFSCPAGDRNIYIQPDGNKLPCKLLSISNQHIGGGQQLDLSNIDIVSLTETGWKKRENMPSTCVNCKFSDVCSPCPLLTHQDRISECEIALAFSKNYDTAILSQPLYRSTNIEKISPSDGQVVIFSKGRKFRISDIGFMIWKNITNSNTILDVIKLTHTQVPNVTQQEIVEFIQKLRKTGLVSFDNDYPTQSPIQCVLICCAR